MTAKNIFVAVSLAGLLVTVLPSGFQDAQARTTQDLKPGEGMKVVESHCVACHDAGLITGAEMTRVQWNQMIDEMIDLQGMGAPTEEDRTIILDYLEKTQSPGDES
jgi:cytochrome c5